MMAVKEAIRNVIKHARASEVRLRIAFEMSALGISIHDDGCGFDPAACPPGHGLGNFKRRLQAIGGSFTIESRLGAGTTVSLRLPVAAVAAGSALTRIPEGNRRLVGEAAAERGSVTRSGSPHRRPLGKL